MNDYVKSDLYRYSGSTSIGAFAREYLKNAAFRWQVAFRLANLEGMAGVVGKMLWFVNASRRKGRIQIPRKVRIGYGLYIGHGGPVIVNETATIGDNCNLSQFVTIGSNSGHAAAIGNGVYIGPNVCVVENVVIGDNVTVGAGSVVTKSLPKNATAAGNYAKVLNYNNPGRFIVRRWGEGGIIDNSLSHGDSEGLFPDSFCEEGAGRNGR